MINNTKKMKKSESYPQAFFCVFRAFKIGPCMILLDNLLYTLWLLKWI